MASLFKDKKLLFQSEELSSIQHLLDRGFPGGSRGEVELEVRFQPYVYSTQKYVGWPEAQIRRIHRECKGLSSGVRKEQDTVYIKSHPSQSDLMLRKIQSGSTVMYQSKWSPAKFKVDISLVTGLSWYLQKSNRRMELQSKALPIHRVRFSKALESPIREEEYTSVESDPLVRKRRRTVYEMPSMGFEVHITETTPGDRIELEVEINVKQYKQVKVLMVALKSLLHIFYPQVSTYISLSRFQSEKFSSLPSYVKPSNRPVNIQEKHIQSNLLHYAVTNKLDGVEYKLWLREVPSATGVSKFSDLILFNDTQLWLVQRLELSLREAHPLWMAEGVVRSSGRVEIHIFDGSTHDYSFQQNGLLHERLSRAQTWVDWLYETCRQSNVTLECDIEVKSFSFPRPQSGSGLVESIRRCVREMTERYGLTEVSEANDGIILEPCDPSLSLSTLKWKFPSKVTIDFRMKKVSSLVPSRGVPLRYELQLVSRNVDQPFSYTNEEGVRTFATYIPPANELVDGIEGSQLDQLIGEFSYDRSTHQWKLHRIRWDKLYPNAEFVANETFPDMMHPRTLVWLTRQLEQLESVEQESFVPISPGYRTYANVVIKKQLIDQWCRKKTVLDIGSGMGGDLGRYAEARVSKLYMVEPERKFVNELEQRLSVLGPIPYTIIVAGGEQSQWIRERVEGRVDVISMMQSLTYFYMNEKKLDQLVETIASTLSPDGTLIGAVMDGSCVQEWLRENDDYIVRSSFSVYPESESSDQYAPMVTTHLHGTQTATHVTEALVDLNRLSEKLEALQLTLTESRPFVNRCRALLDTYILQKELIRREVLSSLCSDLRTFYGDQVVQDYREYIVSEWSSEGDPVLIPLRENPEIRAKWSYTRLWEASPMISDYVAKGLQRIQELSTPDGELQLSLDRVEFRCEMGHIDIPRIQAPAIRGSSLLDRHHVAYALRKEYLPLMTSRYQFQYAECGYLPTDNIVEAYADHDTVYFSAFCSLYPDVDSGSLGRFMCRGVLTTDIIYVVPPSSIRMLEKTIQHIREVASGYTIVLLLPQQDEYIRMADTYLREVTWFKQAYTTLLIDRQTRHPIPHLEYRIGVQRPVEGRRLKRGKSRGDIDLSSLQVKLDERRLLSMYRTFVYQSYKALRFGWDHPLTGGPGLVALTTPSDSMFQAVLMSYLGPSYYHGIEEGLLSSIHRAYRFEDYINSTMSLPSGALPSCIPLIPSGVKTGQEWLNSYPHPEQKELIEGYLLVEMEKVHVNVPMLADVLRVAIVEVGPDTMELYRSRRVDDVVFVYVSLDHKYHATRVHGTSRGALLYEEAIRYQWMVAH